MQKIGAAHEMWDYYDLMWMQSWDELTILVSNQGRHELEIEIEMSSVDVFVFVTVTVTWIWNVHVVVSTNP